MKSNEKQDSTSPKVRWGRVVVAATVGLAVLLTVSTLGAIAYQKWQLSTQHWCADVDEKGNIISDRIMFGDECNESDLPEEI